MTNFHLSSNALCIHETLPLTVVSHVYNLTCLVVLYCPETTYEYLKMDQSINGGMPPSSCILDLNHNLSQKS